MKFETAIAWITMNTKHDTRAPAEKALKWYCAYEYAAGCCEAYNRKNWADALQGDEFDVFRTGTAEEMWNAVWSDETFEVITSEVVLSLKDHFGIE